MAISPSIHPIQEAVTYATVPISVLELSSINFLQSLYLLPPVTKAFADSENMMDAKCYLSSLLAWLCVQSP